MEGPGNKIGSEVDIQDGDLLSKYFEKQKWLICLLLSSLNRKIKVKKEEG